MKNYDTLNEIMGRVGDKHGLNAWYEIFDSEYFDEVDKEICKYFNVDNVELVEGYADWYNELAQDL